MRLHSCGFLFSQFLATLRFCILTLFLAMLSCNSAYYLRTVLPGSFRQIGVWKIFDENHDHELKALHNREKENIKKHSNDSHVAQSCLFLDGRTKICFMNFATLISCRGKATRLTHSFRDYDQIFHSFWSMTHFASLFFFPFQLLDNCSSCGFLIKTRTSAKINFAEMVPLSLKSELWKHEGKL